MENDHFSITENVITQSIINLQYMKYNLLE